MRLIFISLAAHQTFHRVVILFFHTTTKYRVNLVLFHELLSHSKNVFELTESVAVLYVLCYLLYLITVHIQGDRDTIVACNTSNDRSVVKIASFSDIKQKRKEMNRSRNLSINI